MERPPRTGRPGGHVSAGLAETGGGRTQTMRAQMALRERILAGAFPPGARLMEVTLAGTLGISRTPVREAMARLAEEGLLERGPRGGFRVRRFTVEDVIDAIELRGVLEGTAARLAAERGAPRERLAAIREVLAGLEACLARPGEVDLESYAAGNAAFHEALWGLAGSDMVRREAARASALPFASPSAFLPDAADMDAFVVSLKLAQQQHRWIVEAIAAREGSRAEALARDHARIARRNLTYLMEEMAQGPDAGPDVPSLSLVAGAQKD